MSKIKDKMELAEMPQVKNEVEEIFTLVRQKDGVKIAIGNYQVSDEKFDSFKTAEEYIKQKPWKLLANIIGLTVHLATNEKNQTNAQSKAE